MFRSSKLIKLAFVVLGAVVIMSAGQVEAVKMKQQHHKGLAQQATGITPGNVDTTPTEKGCSVNVGGEAKGCAKVAVAEPPARKSCRR